MARPYEVGDYVQLTRKVCVKHFTGVDMAITGEISAIVSEKEAFHSRDYGFRRYGIEFVDRPGVWWYTPIEFKRIERIP